MKMALQLYSVRNTLFSDPERHLKQIREMGYDGAELINFGGNNVLHIAQLMGKNGLEVFSIHTDINEIVSDDESRLACYRDLGCRYMPIGSLPEDRLAGGPRYRETLAAITEYARTAAKYGIRILYHNHDFDFKLWNGKHKLDVLYADLPAEILGAELDTCWIYTAGEDPKAYLEKYAERCPILHLKDCVREGGQKGFRALGEGVLDFPSIVSTAKQLDIPWLCVEQDDPSPGKSAMECAQISAAYLKTLL